MIDNEIKEAILSLHQRGIKIRQISRILDISRNTVRQVLRGKWQNAPPRASRYEEMAPIIQELFKTCRGNAVRVQEILQDQYGHLIPYSTLTRECKRGRWFQNDLKTNLSLYMVHYKMFLFA